MYHSISSNAQPGFWPFVLSPEVFREQMDYLGREGYTPITMSHLSLAKDCGPDILPEKPVVLTFDDGFSDFYTDAFPILQQHGYVATLFIATAYVGGASTWLEAEGEGKRVMLNWQQLLEVVDAGIECGAHCHQHLQLDTVPLATAREGIQLSKNMLEEQLSRRVRSFAYPFGYYTHRLRKTVREAGFTSACAVGDSVSCAGDDPFALPRLWIRAETDKESLSRRLSSPDPLAAVRLRKYLAQFRWLVRRNVARRKRSLALDRGGRA